MPIALTPPQVNLGNKPQVLDIVRKIMHNKDNGITDKCSYGSANLVFGLVDLALVDY